MLSKEEVNLLLGIVTSSAIYNEKKASSVLFGKNYVSANNVVWQEVNHLRILSCSGKLFSETQINCNISTFIILI